MTDATETGTAISGQVLDAMPPQQALTVHTNPYLGMVQTMIERGGDLAKLDQILDLQLKWEANEARKAYVAAMAAFKAEPMEILKRKQVSYKTNSGTTEYMHAELSDVTDAVVPAMGKHGLSHRWDVKQEGTQITVACTITHALGHCETVSITAAPDNSGGKNAIQSVASTISYLQRYTLLSATGMATKGMDDDGRTAEPVPEPEVDPTWYDGIESAIDQHGLKSLKAEMVTAFGSTQAIPKPLIRAYNEKWAAVAPQKAATA